MKLQAKPLWTLLILLNLFVLLPTLGKAFGQAPAGIEQNFDCKWDPETCDDGKTDRDVCLRDGNGGSCACGSVSVPCPPVEPARFPSLRRPF